MDSERFDTWVRAFSTRRVVLAGLVGSGLTALLGLTAAPPEMEAKKKRRKKKTCKRSQRKCGKRCIPKSRCCTSAQCPSGKLCQSGTCVCSGGTKECAGSCIPADACCTDTDCGARRICVAGTCLIGQGTCDAGADICTGAGTTRLCGADDRCGCYRTAADGTRCGDTRILQPPADSPICLDDADCVRAHPDVPGVFCTRGSAGGGGGGSACSAEFFCQAPCPN